MTRLAAPILRALLAATLAAALLAAPGCRSRDVSVRTGERITCTYGHVVSDDVKTIKVPAREASRYSIETSTVVCALHQKTLGLYGKAQDAITAKDYKTAARLLADVVAADKGFGSAAEQLAAIRAGRTPNADPARGVAAGGSGAGGSGAGGGGAAPGGSGVATSAPAKPSGPIASLTRYVPAIEGYRAEPVIADPASLSRAYVPVSGKRVDQLVVQAEQHGDAAAAREAVTALQGAYSGTPSSLTVAGKKAYFGTAAGGLAAIVLADGAVSLAFEMHASQGGASSLRSDLAAVAEQVLE